MVIITPCQGEDRSSILRSSANFIIWAGINASVHHDRSKSCHLLVITLIPMKGVLK